jgi:GAF domain-containing protein
MTTNPDDKPAMTDAYPATMLADALPREQDVTATLVRLADTLVDDFDLVGVLNELAADCVRLLNVTAAGLLLADTAGTLHVVAASSEQTRLLELVQLQRDQGPCLDCFHHGVPVSVGDVGTELGRWPLFAAAALATGYQSVHALPLRLRDTVVGALNLFSAEPGRLTPAVTALGQTLADMATITILQERAVRAGEKTANRLQEALVSRVALEQAKGVLAERGDLSMDDAFVALRKYARNNNLRLRDVSQLIIDKTLDTDSVLKGTRRHNP